MAALMLILLGAAALVVVVAVVALVWVLSGRAKPGGVINPNNDPGVQGARGQSERTNLQNNFGNPGSGI
ncbi:hypothetical protein ACIA03_17085 [Nocardioides sp. NPDC051685]|uniref:hypothetical protein n=1 Tax=Nocardioides sp. NPDC051685 TaxID=3364334 RepID=UPI00378E7E1C